jgi:hypothetical protein
LLHCAMSGDPGVQSGLASRFSRPLPHHDAPCGKRDGWDAFRNIPHARMRVCVRACARARLARRVSKSVPSVPITSSCRVVQATRWTKPATRILRTTVWLTALVHPFEPRFYGDARRKMAAPAPHTRSGNRTPKRATRHVSCTVMKSHKCP